MAYADAADCRSLKGFPTSVQVDDIKLNEWAADLSGELDLVFLRLGVPEEALPITAPPALVSHLKNAVVWGVAARLESAPLLAQPGTAAAGMNVYLAEYLRLKRELEGLTQTDLITIGVIPGLPAITALGSVGLGLVGNDSIDDDYAQASRRPPAWLLGPWIEVRE